MTPMKLAFCLFNYFPFGGLQRDFMRIAKECIQRGHTVDVYTLKWEGDYDPNFTVHVLQCHGWQNHTRSQHFVSQLQKKLQTASYDLVVGFNKMPGLDVYYAADTCLQTKIRGLKSAWYPLLPRVRHWLAYEKAVFQHGQKTKILLIAEAQQAEFVAWYHTEPTRFHLLPPGIARDRKPHTHAEDIRVDIRRTFQLTENDFLLLLIGSGFKTKGLDRALQGIAALPATLKNRTTLIVIGEDKTHSFKQQAKRLGILSRVHFLGGRNDVAHFMWAADLLVHPAYNENTGTVLLEALVAGLPVLTTEICGYAPYIIQARAGVVLPSPYQQNELNHALHSMLLSPDRIHWQHNALSFAEHADIYTMPERAVDIIESMKHVHSQP